MENKIDSELSYIAFVLGYDNLIKEYLKENKIETCDECYDECVIIARLFMNSKEYHNEKYSTYEMLEYWLRNNDSWKRSKELICNMCGGKMEHRKANNTNMYVCEDCPNVQFEYYDMTNSLDVVTSLDGYEII
jgi:hypothetical protein